MFSTVRIALASIMLNIIAFTVSGFVGFFEGYYIHTGICIVMILVCIVILHSIRDWDLKELDDF